VERKEFDMKLKEWIVPSIPKKQGFKKLCNTKCNTKHNNLYVCR